MQFCAKDKCSYHDVVSKALSRAAKCNHTDSATAFKEVVVKDMDAIPKWPLDQ